ncbi:MAG: Muramoyltetrapeptide carboxypeptidase [Streptosporangiaceae bacterium]|jgi:muramoyltetrapeptide carboxypeptidase|nr:Muramoyltetrapeptide carboxypeptidase [Streptosporangiaceae bacterium]
MSGGAQDGAGEGSDCPRVRPPRLRPGDRVAVVAPSGAVDPVRLESGCARLRKLGLDVVIGEHALERATLTGSARGPAGWYGLAGGDAERAADLSAAWCDPDVRAVLCARGGYGATRVLPHLDWTALATAGPKLLHGSSDVTALHVALGSRLGLTTSFGPMIAGLVADGESRSMAHLEAALSGDGAPVSGTRAIARGWSRGVLTGGNLSLLTALLGTPYAPAPAAGGIAFLEDVAESPYRVDRMLTQLSQAGWFDAVAGVALGSWTGCGDPAELQAVLTGRLRPLGVPVLAGLPVGHGREQFTVELGGVVELDADACTLAPCGGR